jgi:hypothetical protein
MIFFFVSGDSTVPAEPMWRMHFEWNGKAGEEVDAMFVASKSVKFCPFCGSEVPKVQLKAKQPAKVASYSDGGYYCDGCSKRLSNCTCNVPEAAWERL